MATPAEIKAYAAKKGIQLKSEAPLMNPRIAELKAALAPVSNPSMVTKASAGQSIVPGGILNKEALYTSSGAEGAKKVADFIGGEKLAEGVGMALKKGSIEKESSAQLKIKIDRMKAIESELLAAKRDGRTKDFERISDALRNEIQTSSGAEETLLEFQKQVPSTKEIIGSTVRLGATLASGAIGRGASSLTGANAAKTVLGGIGRGAGAGAIAGAAEGAVQGAGLGMEQNKDTKGILGSALEGAAIGGAAGGVLGGIAGGVTGKVNKNKLAKQKYLEDLVAPKETLKVKEQGIAEGRMTEPGLFKKSELTSSKRDTRLIESVKDVVSADKSDIANLNSIDTKVKEINAGVKDYIAKNKSPFNTNQLRSKFDSAKVQNKLIFASDTNAEKTYDAVVDEFMKYVKKKDTAGLFEARQTFDKVPAIKKLLDTETLGENMRKTIIHDVRRSANEYIASLLPKGNKYRADLLRQSHMIEVIENISEKEAKNLGLNKLQMMARDYPALKWIVAAIAGGAGVGVGGAIINSTD